jgi:hypothetical protein
MPGSFFVFDFHCGSYVHVRLYPIRLRDLRTFLAAFFCLRCFAADAF